MKELSIEQKAKAYDEAIKRIQSYVVDEYGCTRIKVVNVFPELKESEDEIVKRTLIKKFKEWKLSGDEDETWYGLSYDSVIAWLEKHPKYVRVH